MGRKNKENKDFKRDKEVQDDDDDDEENIEKNIEEEKYISKEEDDRQMEIIWNIRNKMLKYVQINCIPLCDYLEMDDLTKFIGNICY